MGMMSSSEGGMAIGSRPNTETDTQADREVPIAPFGKLEVMKPVLNQLTVLVGLASVVVFFMMTVVPSVSIGRCNTVWALQLFWRKCVLPLCTRCLAYRVATPHITALRLPKCPA